MMRVTRILSEDVTERPRQKRTAIRRPARIEGVGRAPRPRRPHHGQDHNLCPDLEDRISPRRWSGTVWLTRTCSMMMKRKNKLSALGSGIWSQERLARVDV